MRNNYGFVTPESVTDATVRLVDVKAAVTDIAMQLQAIDDHTDAEWEKKARFALRVKKAEEAFLKLYLLSKRPSTPVASSDDDSFEIVPHLKAHSKLVGKLNELFEIVVEHLARDDEDTWNMLQEKVSDIRSVKYLTV